MMKSPSIWPSRRWSLFGLRTAEACPTRRNPSKPHALHRIQRTNAPAKRARTHPFAQQIHPRRIIDADIDPTGGALSP